MARRPAMRRILFGIEPGRSGSSHGLGAVRLAEIQNVSLPSAPTAPWRLPWRRILLLLTLFYACALPLILTETNQGRAAYDQSFYHLHAIETFAQELPGPDLSNYRSATTPAYHLFVSLFGAAVSTNEVFLRLIGSLITAVLFGALVTACTRAPDDNAGFFRVLPFACSTYVFGAGVWLLPDNAAWLGVLFVLLVAMRPVVSWKTALIGGIGLLMLVLTRQIHIWAASMLWMAAWLGPWMHPHSDSLFKDIPGRLGRTGLYLLATIPAFAALGYFFWLWGGLVVPRYQNMYSGWSPATPAFVLSLLGGFGVFFAGDLVPRLMIAWKAHGRFVLVLVGLGVLVAVVPATSYSTDDGRFSGLWNIARRFEGFLLVAGRTNLLLVGMSALGALWLAAIVLSMRLRPRWIVLAGVAGFIAAQSASPMLWQRYNEPFVLMLLAVVLSKPIHRPEYEENPVPPPTSPVVQPPIGPALAPAARVLGPMLLAMLLAVYSFASIRNGKPVEFDGSDPTIERVEPGTPTEAVESIPAPAEVTPTP